MNKSSFIIITIWVFIVVFTNLFGSIEGKFYPVVTDFTYYPISNGGHLNYVFGSFEKLRNCDFEKLRWYIEDSDGRRVRIAVTFDSVNVRHSGRHHFGPWASIASLNQLMNQSVIYSDHSCHPLWYTTTRLR